MSLDLNSEIKILRLKSLCVRIGLGRSTIYDRINKKSPRYDKTFPRPIKLGATAIGWIESEVIAWIQQRVAANDVL